MDSQKTLLVGCAALGAAVAASRFLLTKTQGPICTECDDADAYISLCHEKRLARLVKPSQSAFRVTAVIVFTVDGKGKRTIIGHNDEACCLLNSCCAERAGFLQLSALQGEVKVLGVYITTDADIPITPGALCREYMSSSRWTTFDTTIVMEGAVGSHTRISRTLRELWPFASAYTRLDRAGQVEAGGRLGKLVAAQMKRLKGIEAQAWNAAVMACKGDKRSELHPLMFGASVVFADGSQAVSWQRKALEYGCSLDAVRCLRLQIPTSSLTHPALDCIFQPARTHAPCSLFPGSPGLPASSSNGDLALPSCACVYGRPVWSVPCSVRSGAGLLGGTRLGRRPSAGSRRAGPLPHATCC